MSRTHEPWQERDGSYIETTWSDGRDILVKGTDKYINFNTTVGSTGYGIRDNNGTMQFKNSGGSWSDFEVDGAYLENIVEDTTPQLGGDLDVNGFTITSATNGNILIAPDGTGDVIINTDQLYVDTSTGFIGLGTTTPQTKLEVNLSGSQVPTPDAETVAIFRNKALALDNVNISLASGSSGNARIYFGDIGDENIGYIDYDNADNSMNFGTNAGQRMIITSAGRVGINELSPDARLHISGGSGLAENTGSGAGFIVNRTDGKAASLQAGSTSGVFAFDSSGNFSIVSDSKANILAALLSPSYLFTIQGSDGFAGIGTQTPDAKLDIHLSGAQTPTMSAETALVLRNKANGTDNVNLALSAGSSGSARIHFGDFQDENIGYIDYDNVSNTLKFGTNATQQLKIDSAGVVTVGTGVDVAKIALSAGLNDDSTFEFGGDRTWLLQNDGNASLGTADYFHIYDSTAGESRLTIDTSGNIGIGTVAPSFSLEIDSESALSSMIRYNNPSGATNSAGFLFTRRGGTKASPSNITAGDWLGKFQYRGRRAGSDSNYAFSGYIADSTTNGDGKFVFVDSDGSTERLSIESDTGITTISTTNLVGLIVDRQSNADSSIRISNDTATPWTIGYDNSQATFSIANASDLNSGSQRFVIDESGNVGIGLIAPDYILDVNGAIGFRELSSDPADPDEGATVLWQSNGTGSGDDGDIMMKITAGGVTKTLTLVDYSTV